MRSQLFLLLSILFSGLLIISCSESAEQASAETTIAKVEGHTGIPVEVMVVKKEINRQKVTISGVIQPLHKVDIISEVSGKVEKIHKELGEYVSTRDTLAYIDDKVPYSQFRQAQAQVLSANNNLQIARLNQ